MKESDFKSQTCIRLSLKQRTKYTQLYFTIIDSGGRKINKTKQNMDYDKKTLTKVSILVLQTGHNRGLEAVALSRTTSAEQRQT